MRKFLNRAKNIALPAAGFALGGPLGAAAGGALAGAVGQGRPKLSNIAGGALAGGAAGFGGQALGMTGGQGLGALGGSARTLLTGGGGSQGAIGRIGSAISGNKEVAAGLARGASDAYTGRMASRDRSREMDLMERRFADEQSQRSQEEERRRQIAMLLMPMFQQMQSRQIGQ